MIEFHLDRKSGVSTYLQLVHQVKHALRMDMLRPGDKLPTAKEVVASLAINPNTVLKAYRELEREGLAIGRPGLGTFIESTIGGTSGSELDRLRGALRHWVADARRSGLDTEDLRALFADALHEPSETETAT